MTSTVELGILIVAGSGDQHVEAVRRHLEVADVPHLVLCTDELDDVGISWEGRERAVLERSSGRWTIGSHTTVWWRRPPSPFSSDVGEGPEQDLYREETSAILVGALLAARVRWVDHPAAQWTAAHKLHQLAVANRLGYLTPRSLVTNRPEIARDWATGLTTPILSKPVSSGQGIAPYADFVSVDELELLVHQPALLQEVAPAHSDARVVTIGGTAYCWARDRRSAEPLDWRRIDPRGTAFASTLQPDLGAMSAAMASALDLEFTVQDWLIVDPGQPPVFLEVNTQGAWLFLREAENLIAPRLARHLEGPSAQVEAGQWPKWWKRLLHDLLPGKFAHANDGLRPPHVALPAWLTHGMMIPPDMVEEAVRRRAESEARADNAERRAGKIGQLAMTLLALAFAVGTYTAKRLDGLDAAVRWWTLMLPAVMAVVSLAMSALQGLTAEHSVRLVGSVDARGLHGPSVEERLRAKAQAAHHGEVVAGWSARYKLSESLQARAWLTRGIVLLVLAGVVAATLLVAGASLVSTGAAAIVQESASSGLGVR